MTHRRATIDAPSLPPLSGFLVSNDDRRNNSDSALYGCLRVGGVTYTINVYGPQNRSGTARRRYTVRLAPLDEPTRRGASRGDR